MGKRARDKPTTDELLELRLFLLLFLLLGLSIYVDYLGLSCRLLLDYALDDNDVVIIGLSHVRHRGRCRDHLRLLLRWIVCGYQYGESNMARGGGELWCSRGGGSTTPLFTVGGIEGSSELTVMVVAMTCGWMG